MRVASIIFCLLCIVQVSLALDYQLYSENGKVGIKNSQGQVVVKASFDALGWSDGSFTVINNVTGYRSAGSWGLLNLNNQLISQPDFETLTHAGGDNIIARKKINPAQSKVGCLGLQGQVKIPFIYDGISINGLRAVVFNLAQGKYKYGLTDLNNNIIIPITYRSIRSLGTLRYAIENETGKIALYSEEGKAITEFKIDSISSFKNSQAIVYENLLQGLIDREGELKLPIQYQSININEDGTIAVQQPHEWLLINPSNEIIHRFYADELFALNKSFFMVSQSGMYGLLDQNYQVVCPIKFGELRQVTDSLFIAKLGRKYGAINTSGDVVIPFQYDSLHGDETSLRAYKRIEGWNLIDWNDKPLTDRYYDYVAAPTHSLFPVYNNHYWGLMNSKGEEIIHCIFDSLLQINNQKIVVKYKKQYGLVTPQENWLMATQAIPFILLNDSLIMTKEYGNQVIKNFKGNVIYFTNNKLEFYPEYFIEYLPDGTEKTINYHGVIVNRVELPAYTNIERVFALSEGMRGILREGKYGFVDERGRLRIANRYDDIGEFHEGLAPFKLIGLWGFVDKADQIVIHPNYDSVSNFRNGLSIVSRKGKFGIIDKAGRNVIGLQYDKIEISASNKFQIILNQKRGLADEVGNILIDARFDSLTEISHEMVLVEADHKFGVISTEGLSKIPIIYDRLSFDSEHKYFIAQKKSDWKTLIVK